MGAKSQYFAISEDSHGPRYSPSRPPPDLKRGRAWHRRIGANEEVIGEIDHLLIEKVSGRVAYAVMSFGGIMGLAHSHYPIPWSALKYDKSVAGFRTGITEEQLRNAPEFSDDSWTDRAWETRTHEHYGAPIYWGR